MDAELAEVQAQLDRATERLLVTVGALSDDAVREPSLLPGWSRGHVLTHLARGADAIRNLMVGARTGVPVPAYRSQEDREAAIEAGAERGVAELLADLAATAEKFREEAMAVPGNAWQREVKVPNIPAFPASQLLLRRWVELELHHVDLDAGYRPNDWPTAFVALDLPEPLREQRAERKERQAADPVREAH
jgi:maleylpyruvate isomerase